MKPRRTAKTRRTATTSPTTSKRPAGRTPGAAPLSARHKRFVAEYLIDGNATQAAIRASYSRKTARVQGHRLLTNAAIAAALAAGQQAIAAALNITRDDIARELHTLAFAHVAPKRIGPFDKRAALVDLAKLLGHWQERHHVDAGESLVELLAALAARRAPESDR